MADIERELAPRRDRASIAPRAEHHHRDISGGTARAAVFGVSDGLVSNVSLILGVAGAVSMSAGEYVSMQAQRELFQRELDMERREIRRNPHVETVELTQIYQSRGVDPDRARELAQQMMADPDLALQTHAREELGIDPDQLGSPRGAATSSFVAFAIGALVPLLPWFIASGTAATVASVVLGVIACAVVGVLLARFTGRSAFFSGGRQVAIAAVAGAVTFIVGHLVGVGV